MAKRARSGDKAKYTSTPRKKSKSNQRKGYTSVPRTRGGQTMGEMKYFDTNVAGFAVPASADWTATEADPATFNCLLAPVVGAAANQRIGKSINVFGFKIKGHVKSAPQIDQTAADGTSIIRLLFVEDMQTNSAQAQGEQVMMTNGTANLNVNSFQNIDNFGRFKVLKDLKFTLQNPNMSYDGTNMEQAGISHAFKWNIQFKKPIKYRFNATNGGSVADLVDFSHHVLAITDNTALAPTLSYVCRATYKE